MLDIFPERIGHACFIEEEEWRRIKSAKIPVNLLYLSLCFILVSFDFDSFCWSYSSICAGRGMFDFQYPNWTFPFNRWSSFWYVLAVLMFIKFTSCQHHVFRFSILTGWCLCSWSVQLKTSNSPLHRWLWVILHHSLQWVLPCGLSIW